MKKLTKTEVKKMTTGKIQKLGKETRSKIGYKKPTTDAAKSKRKVLEHNDSLLYDEQKLRKIKK